MAGIRHRAGSGTVTRLPVSEQDLNAYVDGQLSSATARRVEQLIARDARLGLRVRELRALRDLVYRAYVDCRPDRSRLVIDGARCPEVDSKRHGTRPK